MTTKCNNSLGHLTESCELATLDWQSGLVIWSDHLDWSSGLVIWSGHLCWPSRLGHLDLVIWIGTWICHLKWSSGLAIWTGHLDWSSGLVILISLLDVSSGLVIWIGHLAWPCRFAFCAVPELQNQPPEAIWKYFCYQSSEKFTIRCRGHLRAFLAPEPRTIQKERPETIWKLFWHQSPKQLKISFQMPYESHSGTTAQNN